MTYYFCIGLFSFCFNFFNIPIILTVVILAIILILGFPATLNKELEMNKGWLFLLKLCVSHCLREIPLQLFLLGVETDLASELVYIKAGM